jgi:SAM-dependent methyltransferase
MKFLKKIFGRTQIPATSTARSYSQDQPFLVPICETDYKRSQLIERYWQEHPRFQYFKGVVSNAKLLDIGAGSGGLANWRGWLRPNREDIQLYGIDLHKGDHVDKYHGFSICNLDEDTISFEGIEFDTALASHIIEHVKSPHQLLQKVYNRLKIGGTFYIEAPHPRSKDLPPATDFKAQGWPMMISNFFDDSTHLETPSPATLAALAKECGFKVLEASDIQSTLHNELIAYGVKNQDAEVLLYGYWAATQWAHYCTLQKE